MPKKYIPAKDIHPDTLRELLVDYTQQELKDLYTAVDEIFVSKTLLHPDEEQRARDVYEKFLDESQLGSITRAKRRLVLNIIEECLDDDPSGYDEDEDED